MTDAMNSDMGSRPIRDLGLQIVGSRLEPIVAEFRAELHAIGLDAVQPTIYLSSEWGVPDGTRMIAIPFYLVSRELTILHADRVGHVEGRDPADILRYLRHEMGHVVNYAYRLFVEPRWAELFGSMAEPYRDEYHPIPFSRDFVNHLPGWYAQKHPDEDWAETFAVWMTPAYDWRSEYAAWPGALRKLEYCDRTLRDLAGREPFPTSEELDEDVSEISASLDEFYACQNPDFVVPERLDSALLSIFDDADPSPDARRPASDLILGHTAEIAAEIYRWTGRFPEWTKPFLHHLATRSDAIGLSCASRAESAALIRLTAFATSLASHRSA